MNDRYYLAVHNGHNASAALMQNGEVIAAIQEERVTRRKNQMGYPKRSIEFCLNWAGISGKDLSKVGLTTKEMTGLLIKSQYITQFTILDYLNYYGDAYYGMKVKGQDCVDYLKWLRDDPIFNRNEEHFDFSYLTDEILKDGLKDVQLFQKEQCRVLCEHLNIGTEKIEFLDHHTCHAHYAYFSSPLIGEEAIVLTLDSHGDGRNQTVWHAKDNKLTLLAESSQSDVAHIYKMTTLLLGMRPDEHEYKVMGLAPYAKKTYVEKIAKKLENLLDVEDMRIIHKNRQLDLFAFLKKAYLGERFDNIAGGVQLFTENIVTKLFQNIYQETGISRFVLSGGVSMNVKMNKAIAELSCVTSLFVPGSGGDESLPIGGLYLLNGLNNKPLNSLYLGPEMANDYPSIEWDKIAAEYTVRHKVSVGDVAQLLSQGDIVSTINGRTEFGARALGNRSILADPRDREVIKKINEAIKNRDFWMPFALSLLEDEASGYIKNPKKLPSPFMTMAFDTLPEGHSEIQAGTHPYDHTVRPQFVSKKYAFDYHNLISAFCNITGVPALLNTSFNLHGEPIVNDFKDALKTFRLSGIDHLFVNNRTLLSKKN